jgi:hypothetical protein
MYCPTFGIQQAQECYFIEIAFWIRVFVPMCGRGNLLTFNIYNFAHFQEDMTQWLGRLQAVTGRHVPTVQYSPAPPQSSSTPVPAEQQSEQPSEPAPKAKKGGFFSKGRKS